MSWAKLDDHFHAHRKAKRAWRAHPRALGMHLLAMSYCAGQLTDGLVDDEFVEEKIPGARERQQTTAALVDAELWVREDDGWRINDWLDFNPSRAEVETSRGVDRFRKELTRDPKLIAAIRERDGNVCRYCGTLVDWRDRRSKIGGTYDHVTPVSQGGQNVFDNVVVACRGCNGRKGARTPEQAGMGLLPLSGSSPDLAGSSPSSSPTGLVATNPDPTRPDPTLLKSSGGGRARDPVDALSAAVDDPRLTATVDILRAAPRLTFDAELAGVANVLAAYPDADHTQAAHVAVANSSDPNYRTTDGAKALRYAISDLQRQPNPVPSRRPPPSRKAKSWDGALAAMAAEQKGNDAA